MSDQFKSKLTAQLKKHEGCRLKPYTDTTGNLTVGYGHNLNQVISQAQADKLLKGDMAVAIDELSQRVPFWHGLPLNARLVLVDMQFNMGWPAFSKFKRFWLALEQREFRLAAKEMRDSLWFKQVGTRGVTLAKMMEGCADSVEV